MSLNITLFQTIIINIYFYKVLLPCTIDKNILKIKSEQFLSLFIMIDLIE